MPSQMTNEGLEQLNNAALSIGGQFDMEFALFNNNYTPLESSVFGDFSLSSLSGAGPTPIDPGDWVTTSSGGVFGADLPTVTLTFAPYGGSPETIYGVLVYDATNNVSLWAQLLPLPVVIPNSGGTLDVTLHYEDGACPV